MADGSWIDTVFERIEARNEVESRPFEQILQSNKELWKKFVHLESCRVGARHNIAVLEHEIADTVNRGDFELAARNAAKKISVIGNDLQPFGRKTGKVPVNLSRTVYDLRKLITKLEEELRLAKVQIADTFSSLAGAQEEATSCVTENDQLKKRVADLEQSLATRERDLSAVQAENKELTMRIITEKNKSAAQLDEMNKLLHRK